MNKRKWLNFQGALLAGATLAGVAVCAKHVQKKYGEKPSGFSVDYKALADYAFEKFILNNDKFLDTLGSKLEPSESKGEATAE